MLKTPISINTLLVVADMLDEQHGHDNEITPDDFNAVCKGNIAERNRRSILTAFRHMGFLSAHPDLEILPRFRRFIKAWNAGDELLMNSALRDYAPYQTMLFDLKHLRHVSPDDLQSSRMRTLTTMAMALGEAYRCPYGTGLYYGGALVSLADFRMACNTAYDKAPKTGNTANLCDLAHAICLELSLSHQAFRKHWQALLKTTTATWKQGPATIRRHLQTHLKLCSLYPRQQILNKRIEARLLGRSYTPKYLHWFWLQDGINLESVRNVKLVTRISP